MQGADLFPLDGREPLETMLRRRRYRIIAGVDEVGRGSIAGPVVAAVVILRNLTAGFVADIDDSKKLSADERARLARLIHRHAVAVGIGVVEHAEVDRINILQASFAAMRAALARIEPPPDHLLVDGHLRIPDVTVPQLPVVQGDARSKSIGAASIVAKVHRDTLMVEYHDRYPQYQFARNKGYGTEEHWKALREHGPCPIHRLSFQGVANPDERNGQLVLTGADVE